MDCRLDNGWQGMQSCHTDSRLIVFAGQAIARLAGPLGVAGLFGGVAGLAARINEDIRG